MKKTIKALKITSVLSLITLVFVACDKDFSTLESDIKGSQNFDTNSEKLPVVAYNKKLEAVQSNGLSANLLGVYKDDIYGLTTASVVTQATLANYDPDFGDSPELVSVILSVPYFSTLEETVDGESTYSMTEKDSLYGSTPINLSVYKHGYFLRDFDPENVDEFQKYYSNGNTTINFDNHIDDILYEDDSFFPSASEVTINEGDDDEEKLEPRFRKQLNMPDGYWENLFFNKEGMPELSNENNFKDYFRGLYFKASLAAGQSEGLMLMLDFGSATIELNYTNLTGDTEDDGSATREDQVLQINLTGNRINLFENDDPDNTLAIAANGANNIEGDNQLYLKGGEGGIAVIDLFGATDADNNGLYDAYEDFMDMYTDQRLINEANLVFYVDETAGVNKDQEPSRVVLYDLRNNIPVVDYFIDIPDATDPENSRTFHSTILEKDSDGNGVKYKVRLTEHLNNILLKDSTNYKLGLMVTTNINEVLEYATYNSDDKLSSGSVMSPKGTVLHGSNLSVSEDQRVQLEIFYTEPKN